MKLDGIHHVTCITGDAPRNVEFYAGTLGLRLVKKTVNQDDPTVYHLFYADEHGSAGRRHHVLRVPGRAAAAAPATGWCTASSSASAPRSRSTSGRERVGGERVDGVAASSPIPKGSSSSWSSTTSGDAPLVATHPEIPEEHALRGFAGVRAYAVAPERERARSSTASASTPRLGVARRHAQRLLRLRRRRRPSAASPAPAPCTTSRGRCRSTSTQAWRAEGDRGRRRSRRR